MSSVNPSSAEFFEEKYQDSGDPWNFAGDKGELRRYDAIVTALEGRRYKRAFEPGCSVGVLTERLAEICDAVNAVDFSPTAAAAARRRCHGLGNVEVVCGSITDVEMKDETDLLVLSEIGYYFAPEVWMEMAGGLIRELRTGAVVLAAHWLGESEDHAMSGDEVHEILLGMPGLRLELSERYEGFRLDRWERI